MLIAKPDYVDVRPGTLAQVQRSQKGVNVAVTDDVQGVAQDLLEISPDLRLTFNPHEDVWIVWQEIPQPDGSVEEQIVTTAQELDKRLVNVVRRCCSDGYDLAAEIERAEAAADRAHEHAKAERFGEAAERLAHAFQKDLSRNEIGRTMKSRAFIPGAFRP